LSRLRKTFWGCKDKKELIICNKVQKN
jgi:hypothetical protein